MDGGRGDIPAPLWADAAALQADRDALAAHPAAQRMVAVLDAAIRGRTHVTALFPPIGRQKAEKATPAKVMRAAIYAEIITRIEPRITDAGAANKLPVSQIHRAIDGLIDHYTVGVWANQSALKQQPPRGEYGFDDLFWRLFRLGIPPKVSRPTIDAIIKKHLPSPVKRRRN